MQILLRLLVALSSGVLFAFVAPPVNLAWAHWFLWVPVFWSLRPDQHRTNAALGYASTVLATFLLYFWIIETVVLFSSLPWVVGLLVHILFSLAFSLPYILTFGLTHWIRQRLGLWWVLLVPALHVALEKTAPQLFPYYQGVTQYRQAWIWQISSVFSVMGLSYLLLVVNCALAEVLYRRREGRSQPVAALVGVALSVAAAFGFGAWRHGQIEAALHGAPVLKTALLQQDITMDKRLAQSPLRHLKDWVALTKKLEGEEADLLIWPEGAIMFNPNEERTASALGDRSPREFFEDLAADYDVDFVLGGGTAERLPEPNAYGQKYEAYNSVYYFRNEDGLSDRYDKMVPLPFGEYIPLSDTFPFLKGVIKGPGDFRKGTRPTLFTATVDEDTAYTFTIPICYEAILERAMWPLFDVDDREAGVRQKADFFVNITNDGWFGDTASPHQHAMLTTVQAIHFGRPLVRSAFTGVSWVVEPHGVIKHETKPFEEVAEVVDVRMKTFETGYVRGGWVFPWLCIAGTLGGLALARRREPTETGP